ncbi:MAG: glycosyltransferase [candidate division NC10 bacterium]|nr:glycosyltransferase [candidate division NC10 bacterium]
MSRKSETADTGPEKAGSAHRLRLSVVIPVYNEERCIATTLAQVARYLGEQATDWELVVVDDGSTDATRDRVLAEMDKQPQLRLLQHDTNRGKGAAVRTGVLNACGELMLVTDADLSVPIESFDRFEAAMANGADIAIGSRRLPGACIEVHQPRVREFMGQIFTFLANAILGMHLSDFTCGFKVFRRLAAQALFAAQRRDDRSYDAEILYGAQRDGWRTVEVPVRWANVAGSKVRPVHAAVLSLLGLLQIRARFLTHMVANRRDSLQSVLVRNTLANATGWAWGLLIGLVLTPYIVHHIGTSRFGIFALVNALLGYVGLLDLGIAGGAVKYIAAFHAERNREKLNDLINTGAAFYAVLGIAILAVGMPAGEYLVGLFRIEPPLAADALFVFRIGLLGFALGNVTAVFSAVPFGLQRMRLANGVGIVMSILHFCGSIVALELGYGLRGLVVNGLLMIIISGVIWLALDSYLLAGFALHRRYVRRNMLSQLFGFGIKLQVSRMADLISFQFDKLLLGRFISLDAVANYHVGSRVVDLGRNISQLVIPVLVPAASELDARSELSRLQNLYQRAYKYVLLTAMPLMVFVALHAEDVVSAWMGPGFGQAATTVRVLALGYFLNLMTGPAVAVGAGIGHPEIQMKAWIWMAASNIVLSLWFILLFGYPGVLVATTLSLGSAHVINLVLFHRHLKLPIVRFLARAWRWPIVACAAGWGAMNLVEHYAGVRLAILSRLERAEWLLVFGVAFSCAYILVILRSRYLDEVDRRLVWAYFHRSDEKRALGVRVEPPGEPQQERVQLR